MELIIKLGWIPDVIHLNDWQCGLIPAYLKTVYKDQEGFDTFKTLFTVHNLAYQGEFPVTTFKKTGLPKELESVSKGIVHNGKINFMKSGLMFADVINTVSQTYANEIRTKEEYGEGLKDVLAKRKDSLFGIVNGIDKNAVSYTHLRAHETVLDLVCRLLLEKNKKKKNNNPHTLISET